MNIQIKRLLLSFISISISTSAAYAAVFDINCEDVSGLINSINTANGNGEAGLFHVGISGKLTINETAIENGSAVNITDGGWRAGGAIFNRQTLILNNSSISGNTAQLGGGIINFGATTTLNNCIVSRNTSFSGLGGGIYAENTTLTLNNSIVSKNNAGVGGGIGTNLATLTLLNTTVSENTATNNAGGELYNSRGPATLTNSTFSNNTAAWGGAIFIISDFFGMSPAILTNNTISGNTATQGGGGISTTAVLQ
jgi:predicted outer membrane repeat protein